MYFKKFLERYFDVEREVIFEDTDKEKLFPLERFELYEKGEDCEYILSLTLEPTNSEEMLERRMSGLTYYKVGNVYSCLAHNSILEEKELREIIKNKSYLK